MGRVTQRDRRRGGGWKHPHKRRSKKREESSKIGPQIIVNGKLGSKSEGWITKEWASWQLCCCWERMCSVGLDQGRFVCPAFVFCFFAVTLKRAWVSLAIGGSILGPAQLKSTVVQHARPLCRLLSVTHQRVAWSWYPTKVERKFFSIADCGLCLSHLITLSVVAVWVFSTALHTWYQWKLVQEACLALFTSATTTSCSTTSEDIVDRLTCFCCHQENAACILCELLYNNNYMKHIGIAAALSYYSSVHNYISMVKWMIDT